jgi:hypothetical protein
MTRRPGVHVRARREVDARFQAESLVERGLQIGEPFSPAESLRAGDKRYFVFLFRLPLTEGK